MASNDMLKLTDKKKKSITGSLVRIGEVGKTCYLDSIKKGFAGINCLILLL